ncbi:MAG: RNA polymerase factor sigma-54 [Chloroflexota bacterium]|nr:RNA polymerase factor sigma-54 [Chloroflexota bacterium]MDE3194286.1 RNA polymerase factor sigma-54 [Chloroflexota bacterium]
MDIRLLPQQQLKVTPKQIAANYILQLSSIELQEVIDQELEENPALDLEEVQVCPLCGGELQGRVCVRCFGTGSKPTHTLYTQEDEPLEGTNLMVRDEDDEEFDPIARAEAETTLAEYLNWNVRVLLPKRLHKVAEEIVGDLNDMGYLEVKLEEVANAAGVSVPDAEQALRAIQSVEPWGLGARDTRECLLIQMDRLEELGEEVPPHARAIVADHLRELGEHKFGDVAQALRISRENVQTAWEWVKANLNPYPANAFAAGPGGDLAGQRSALRPDVLIYKNEEGQFEVEVVESRRFSLRVNPVYRQLVGQLQAARAAPAGDGSATPSMNDQERQHIREYVTRAKFFIDNINQRRQTMGRITNVIVECQRDFLEQGIQHLRPLTRAEVGERIGMHESTVSRATAGKFVLLPSGQVVPFSMFFTASLGVKDVIKNIIEAEDRARPFSDQEIVEKLREEHGIRLARRTVAKYREELQILPARLRKQS